MDEPEAEMGDLTGEVSGVGKNWRMRRVISHVSEVNGV